MMLSAWEWALPNPWRSRRNPARELALIGHAKRRRSVRETAAQIRREMNLPPDPRLAP